MAEGVLAGSTEVLLLLRACRVALADTTRAAALSSVVPVASCATRGAPTPSATSLVGTPAADVWLDLAWGEEGGDVIADVGSSPERGGGSKAQSGSDGVGGVGSSARPPARSVGCLSIVCA